jgi:hypothetical protein
MRAFFMPKGKKNMQSPVFSVSLNSVLSAINSNNLLSILSSTIYPPFGIYYAAGSNANKKVIDFNSVLKFEHVGASTITSAPVEAMGGFAGSYSSVNKIAQPARINMRIAIEGATAFSGQIPAIPNIPQSNNGLNISTSRSDVIAKLEQMKVTADIYNIETPDCLYANYDLVNYSFLTAPNNGLTLLIVDLVFQEVRTLVTVQNIANEIRKSTTTKVEANKETGKKEVL